MALILPRKPEPTSFTSLRTALEADIDYFEKNYWSAGEHRRIRASLIICYGGRYMVTRHGDVSVDHTVRHMHNQLEISWPVADE